MNAILPHIVQYQGSKRLLAKQILSYAPDHFTRLIEPFAGTAAVSVAAAHYQKTEQFFINDVNQPLLNLLKNGIENPEQLIISYTHLWNEQFQYGENHVQHFYEVRDRFNSGEQTAVNMLYLLSRCVKGSVRYNKQGEFNQSPDKRRHGTSPEKFAGNVRQISALLKNKTSFSSSDYREILKSARPGDLIYMDPPYQGVSASKDCRYLSGISFQEFVDALAELNRNEIDFLVSYDGKCGSKDYGEELPVSLNCKKVLLNAGTSAQSLLNGKKEITLEALYISPKLAFVSERKKT